VDQYTVRRWLRLGKLRGKNHGGQMGWRVRGADLLAFLVGDEDPTTAPPRSPAADGGGR
jgi:hypothetical protein